MKRSYLVAVLALFIFIGLFSFNQNKSGNNNASDETKNEIKNAEMLDNGNQTPIATIENLEYYPGAKGYFVKPEAKSEIPGNVIIH